jgi:hypothetical protein
VSSHIGSFANLARYPPFKPTSSFVLTSLTNLSLEYGDDTSQEGTSKGRFKSPLIKHPVSTLTPLPLCSGTSKRLSTGEEVGTMQIRVLGEIKMNKMRGEKKSKVPHMSKRKKEKKKLKKIKKRKRKNGVIIISPGSLDA